MRPTLQELADRLDFVRSSVPVGNWYRHQSSGKVYKMVGHSIREEDGEVLVTYEAVHGFSVPFSRPFAGFFETVSLPGGPGPRFRHVSLEEGRHG